MSTFPDSITRGLRSIISIIKELFKEYKVRVIDIKVNYNRESGLYILIMLDCIARDALRYWDKVIERLKEYEIPVFILWNKETNVEPEKLGAHLGRIMAKMNIFLSTDKPIDSVMLFKEE